MARSPLAQSVMLLSGAYTMLLLRQLPPDRWLVPAAVVMLLCLCIPAARAGAVLLLGFVLIWVESREVIGGRLDPPLAGRDLTRSFRIVDFPDRSRASTRLTVSSFPAAGLPDRIRLSWFESPHGLEIGDCWRLTVRLRRPRGWSNPGTFDYEGWLFRQSIGATGYVRQGERLLDCEPTDGLTRLRRRLATRLTALLPDDDATAVMLAITIGARHKIGAEQWQRYASTGTGHLMAISGMHIGLAAGGGFVLVWCALAAIRRGGNHRDHAAIAALVLASAYAAVSGFAVPARRALTMLGIGTLGILLRRPVASGRLLGLTCLIVTLQTPRDVLSPGFQLSFAAVAVLMLAARRSTHASTSSPAARAIRCIRQLGNLQISLLLGLLPLTVLLFDRTAWLAPAVNLLVLPVFNLVAVPGALAGLALGGPFESLGDCLLRAAWHSIHLILAVIVTASGIVNARLDVAELSGIAMLAAWLAVLWVVLPAGWPGRRLAWLAALATVLHAPARPPTGCVDVHALDVGQGLATVVQTRRRTVVFDTGPSYRSGSDAGTLVVVPFLRGLGARRVDLLVVSHSDLDHAGGARSLARGPGVDALLVGEALPEIGVPQYRCRAGQVWHWDEITFTLLHPGVNTGRRGNSASCVLEIRAGGRRALLTGDIESSVERSLVADGLLSPADLVMIPHHGSGTSSHGEFVAALRPRVAIASAGFRNRWGMPKHDVIDRWEAAGATVLNTSHVGAVSARLCADGEFTIVGRQRVDARRIWHER